MPKMLVVTATLILQVAYVLCQNGAGSTTGTNYRVISAVSNTSNFLQVGPDGAFRGFIWDLLNALKDITGFDFTVSIQADGDYGSPDASGNWDGMIGQLLANNVDIIATDLTITSRRHDVIDYTIPFLYYSVVRVTQPNAQLDGIKYAVRKDSGTMTLLQDSITPALQAIWANIQANAPTSLAINPPAGLALAQQGGWAYLTPDTAVAVALANANGQLVITGPPLATSYYGLGVRIGDKLAKTLSASIAKLNENGKLQSLLVKWGFGK